jgi:hypothetical protein
VDVKMHSSFGELLLRNEGRSNDWPTHCLALLLPDAEKSCVPRAYEA